VLFPKLGNIYSSGKNGTRSLKHVEKKQYRNVRKNCIEEINVQVPENQKYQEGKRKKQKLVCNTFPYDAFPLGIPNI
jgi:hypothetical protein